MTILPGTPIKYRRFGEERSGVVDRLSRDGSIVFLRNGHWLHIGSVTPDPTLPADIVKVLLEVGPVEWGATEALTDEEHLEHFRTALENTRKYYELDEPTEVHGVYLQGQNIVLAHTGNSPNSPNHARILAGAWNQLVEMARAQNA